MLDAMKQAVAKASKPFPDGVSELLGHEFSAKERLALCGELAVYVRAFFTLASLLMMALERQSSKKEE